MDFFGVDGVINLFKIIITKVGIQILFLTLFALTFSSVNAKSIWQSYDQSTNTWVSRTQLDLDEILEKHKEWLISTGLDTCYASLNDSIPLPDDPRRANLTKARFIQYNLDFVDLRFALLDAIDFKSASIMGALLTGATLRRSRLESTSLIASNIEGADFSNSHSATDLDIRQCVFQSDSWIGVDLQNAYLPFGVLRWKYWDAELNSFIPFTKSDLDSILQFHLEWLEEFNLYDIDSPDLETIIGSDSRRANLVKANFSRGILDSCVFRFAILNSAIFNNTSLQNADFTGAILNGVSFIDANLSNSYLTRASVFKCDFGRANILGAHAKYVDFSTVRSPDNFPSNLRNVDFTGSSLVNISLENADLWGANMLDVIYQPFLNPVAYKIAYAKNLQTLRYKDNPTPLLELKKKFRDAGFRTAERQVQAAFHKERYRHDPSLDFVRILGFICDYGANPGRSLIWIFRVWLVCSILYSCCMIFDLRFLGWFSWVDEDEYENEFDFLNLEKLNLKRMSFSLGIGLLFGLMSTSNIRFKELEFGRWITKLWIRDFNIKATGLPRVISGVQSLISLILLFTVFLSLFSNFFDV